MKVKLKTFDLRLDRIAVGVFIGFYLLFGICATLFQERLVYLPSDQDFTACPEFADAAVVRHGGTRLYFKAVSPRTVVFYHGNAGSACDRAFLADVFAEAGYSSLFPEYEGYSNDGATPSHAGVQRTVADTVAYLSQQQYESVAVMGESIGAGAAALHAASAQPDLLVLRSPFTSLPDVAAHRFWYYPTSILVRDPFNIPELISAVESPTLIVHGARDTLIPIEQGRTVYGKLPGRTNAFVEITQAGHNDIYGYPETLMALKEFLATK